jgi:hypothetical protein
VFPAGLFDRLCPYVCRVRASIAGMIVLLLSFCAYHYAAPHAA